MSRPAAVQLRGHHLLCILTFIGKGYTEAFVENMADIVARINKGAPIEIIAGPDDICGALRQGAVITCAHAKVCRSPKIRSRDNLALKDVARILQIPLLKAGDRLTLGHGEIKHMRRHFMRGAIRRACMSCRWRELCSQIADDNFSDVKLRPASVPPTLKAG